MRQLVLASQVRVAWGTSAQAKGTLTVDSPPRHARTRSQMHFTGLPA